MTAKRKLAKEFDLVQGTYTLGLPSGKTLTGSFKDFPKEIQYQYMVHGFSQKMTDCGAGRTPEEFEVHLQKVLEKNKAGEWTAASRGTGGGTSRVTQLVEAVARFKKMSVADAKAKVDALSEQDRKNLAASPTIQAVIQEIKAEKAAAKKKEAKGAGDEVLGSL